MVGKRLFDITVSLLVLALTFPLLLFAVIGLKFSSNGPVFYLARRVGRDRKIFTMHKFRTMHVHDPGEGPVITSPNDIRIFPFGNLLRKLKIDELPQFIDVLRGKMSVVGPRPEDPDIVDKYYSERHLLTLLVKPGVTSPASIDFSIRGDQQLDGNDVVGSYVANILDPKLEIELNYIKKSGLVEDTKIVLKTGWFVMQVFWGFLRAGVAGTKSN